MDKALEKFGIYDFFGIWVPGALTVTYYLFTLRTFFSEMFNYLGIKQNGLSGDFLLIILYTAIAYIVGVILHETGKLLADCIKWFRLSDINKRMFKKDILRRPYILPLRKIKYDYQQSFKKNGININEIVEFDKAVSYLKFENNISTNRIDRYHAIYALSRSLCLCFIINLLLLLTNHWWFGVSPHWLLVTLDFSFSCLFFIRTYRYFHGWVKNVYLQYYKVKSTIETIRTTDT